jgi:hypothetical protein
MTPPFFKATVLIIVGLLPQLASSQVSLHQDTVEHFFSVISETQPGPWTNAKFRIRTLSPKDSNTIVYLLDEELSPPDQRDTISIDLWNKVKKKKIEYQSKIGDKYLTFVVLSHSESTILGGIEISGKTKIFGEAFQTITLLETTRGATELIGTYYFHEEHGLLLIEFYPSLLVLRSDYKLKKGKLKKVKTNS